MTYHNNFYEGFPIEHRSATELENDTKYEGDWIIGSDVLHGRGALIMQDGTIYEGWFKDNKMNGKGRIVSQKGELYEGDWKDNIRCG